MRQIKEDCFSYREWFPNSRIAERFDAEWATTEQGVLVKTLLRQYLDWKRKEVELTTYRQYYHAVENVLIPQFGDYSIRDLRLDHVRAWIRSGTRSQKRLCNVLTPLRHVTAEAAEDGKIPNDPLAGLIVRKRKQIDGVRKHDYAKIDPFTDVELAALFLVLHPQVANYARFNTWTGLRPEEMLALRWGDVDLAGGTVHIQRAKTLKVEKGTKTKAGLRHVVLLPKAREALKAQKAHTYLMGDYVFHNPQTNRGWDVDKQVREWHWRPACKRADVRYRPPAQLRHTYASRMLTAGESIAWLSAQMGHENTNITLSTYATLIKDNDPNAGHKADRMFDV